MGLAANRCGDAIDPAGYGPPNIEVTQVLVVEEWTSYALLSQLMEHFLRRFSFVYVHLLKLLFNPIILAISLIRPPNDRSSLLPGKGTVKMVIYIDRFNQSEIKDRVTAVTAVDFAGHTVLVALLDGCKNLVYLSYKGLIFLKGL
jgi:hypothetical protein